VLADSAGRGKVDVAPAPRWCNWGAKNSHKLV
jgi:hypothetical protein